MIPHLPFWLTDYSGLDKGSHHVGKKDHLCILFFLDWAWLEPKKLLTVLVIVPLTSHCIYCQKSNAVLHTLERQINNREAPAAQKTQNSNSNQNAQRKRLTETTHIWYTINIKGYHTYSHVTFNLKLIWHWLCTACAPHTLTEGAGSLFEVYSLKVTVGSLKVTVGCLSPTSEKPGRLQHISNLWRLFKLFVTNAAVIICCQTLTIEQKWHCRN